MRYSEFIRIGASWSKQAFGAFKRDDGSTCARGSACEVLGTALIDFDSYNTNSENSYRCEKVESKFFPYLKELVKHPKYDYRYQVYLIVMDLNDQHRWTREQIADWLEKLEIKNGWDGVPGVKEKMIKREEVVS